jgi:chromosome segregation ATPase
MDQAQLEKRVAWLDDEHRKDKNLIAMLEERISALESRIVTTEQKNKDLSADITHLSTITSRMDNFDSSIEQHRVEFNKLYKKQANQIDQRVDDITSVLRAEIHAFDSSLNDVRKSTEPITGLRNDIQARVQEEERLAQSISVLQREINELRRNEEEQSRIYRLIEDGRRQDGKRLTDIQGEMSSVRKRSDEQRGRIDLVENNHRKMETRLNELLAVEQDRREAQVAFLEKQTLNEVERDRTWKDWQTRFELIEKQSADLESQLQILDSTHLTIKRMQDNVDELILRVERRINEIVEMQRLAEERFRQEWATFKADDQKRWTNYTLSQEEQRSEVGRRFERVADRVTYLEDSLQELQDLTMQINEMTVKRLQSLLSVAHEWVNEFEKSQGGSL